MIRKFITILLLNLFFIATNGFTINVHNCGGKMVELLGIQLSDHCCDPDALCEIVETTIYQYDEDSLDQGFFVIEKEKSFEVILFLNKQFVVKLEQGFTSIINTDQFKIPNSSVNLAEIQSFLL